MPKVITSPVKKFKGTVTIPEYLNIMQVREFENSLPSLADIENMQNDNTRVYISVGMQKKLPVILSVVSVWNIEGIPKNPTIETFPATPIKPVSDLVDWIYLAIRDIWVGEIEIPNE